MSAPSRLFEDNLRYPRPLTRALNGYHGITKPFLDS
jgi:hypothetical protein